MAAPGWNGVSSFRNCNSCELSSSYSYHLLDFHLSNTTLWNIFLNARWNICQNRHWNICQNISQILHKTRHCMVGTVLTARQLSPSSFTKILYKCYANNVQILHNYYTNIAQILHKIKTVVTARQLSLSSAFIFHQNIFSWRAQPNPLTTQNI